LETIINQFNPLQNIGIILRAILSNILEVGCSSTGLQIHVSCIAKFIEHRTEQLSV